MVSLFLFYFRCQYKEGLLVYSKCTVDNLIKEGFSEEEAHTLHWTAYGNGMLKVFSKTQKVQTLNRIQRHWYSEGAFAFLFTV